MENKFIERRKEYRLPFLEKAVFTDGKRSIAAQCSNLSRGGLFVQTLDPYPIETEGHLLFLLPGQNASLCLKAKAVHIVQDKKKCEIDCGIGFQFMDITSQHRSRINLYIMAEQMAYLELRDILKTERPDNKSVQKIVRRLPWLKGLNLLSLRYRVERVCAMVDAFSNHPNLSASA